MDISILGEACIKIRGRLGAFIVDPTKDMVKNNADGILLQNPNEDPAISRVLDYRIAIHGPGDYEVSGIKVSGKYGKENLIYRLLVDGVGILLGKASEIARDERVNPCDILLLDVDSGFTESLLTTVDPKVVILYGNGVKVALRLLGKESLKPVKKFATTKDKLPEEMEIVALG